MEENYEKGFEVAINFIKEKGLYEEYKMLRPEEEYGMNISIPNKEDFILVWNTVYDIFLKNENTPATIVYNDKALKIVNELIEFIK